MKNQETYLKSKNIFFKQTEKFIGNYTGLPAPLSFIATEYVSYYEQFKKEMESIREDTYEKRNVMITLSEQASGNLRKYLQRADIQYSWIDGNNWCNLWRWSPVYIIAEEFALIGRMVSCFIKEFETKAGVSIQALADLKAVLQVFQDRIKLEAHTDTEGYIPGDSIAPEGCEQLLKEISKFMAILPQINSEAKDYELLREHLIKSLDILKTAIETMDMTQDASLELRI